MQNELYDIYPVVHVPFWQTTWFFWFMVIDALLIFLVAGWYIYKKIKARAAIKTPWDQALYELRIVQKTYTKAPQGKDLYMALTMILKKYLHARYGYDVYSKTDQEMIEYLREHAFNLELIEQLRAITEGSALIKFANMAVVEEQMKRDVESSIFFVKKTILTTNA